MADGDRAGSGAWGHGPEPMPLPSGPAWPGQPFPQAFESVDPLEDAFLAELGRRGFDVVERPNTLLVAEVLSWCGSGLLVLLALLLGVMGGIGAGSSAALLVWMGVGGLVQAVLQLLGTYFVRRGYNGGRILLTVIGGLNILLDVPRILAGELPILVLCLYVAVVLVLLWRREAGRFFASERAQRRVAEFVHDTYG